ncbi:Metallo-hydrolase/oxidoreductase [Mycena maculata]|uniref:Metallo-hydrolase/oxidoreductase n=1 Tax=Mycena maculata TaxID=230809 RepID=A0AAD7IWZ1_9AGAR|nr:Metallo-hydrolase/oxidoreductase [Mycena maculata]
MADTLKISEGVPSLPAPSADQPYMHISAMQAGIIHIPTDLVVAGESHRLRACPSMSFYLKHSASDRHFIFDLGIRRNWDSYPPEQQKHYTTLMPCEVPQTVAESCVQGGLDPAEIETVVISHLHFDHIGDCAPFTKASFILGGEGQAALEDGYPKNPKSLILAESTPADRTTFLGSADFNTSIGPFPYAHDFFGDGSVYIIHTPGHCAGHITVLARTSSDGAWLYLGGDVAHDIRLITEPDKKIATATASGSSYCMHRDVVQAAIDISRVRAVVQLPRVDFIVAHDWKWYGENLGSAFLPGKIVPKS